MIGNHNGGDIPMVAVDDIRRWIGARDLVADVWITRQSPLDSVVDFDQTRYFLICSSMMCVATWLSMIVLAKATAVYLRAFSWALRAQLTSSLVTPSNREANMAW